jgi:hypothetical protein
MYYGFNQYLSRYILSTRQLLYMLDAMNVRELLLGMSEHAMNVENCC